MCLPLMSLLCVFAEVDNRAAPSITTNPSNMTVELHDNVALSCTATGNPTPSIRWYKDDKQIEGPQAIGNVFVIPEITPNERGFYQCKASSSFGRAARSKVAVILIQGTVVTLSVYRSVFDGWM